MNKTIGYVYFAFWTEDKSIESDIFDQYLSIKPTNFRKRYESRKYPICTIWKYATPKVNKPDFQQEIDKLITHLEPHQADFQKLKEDFPAFNSILQVVLHAGDEIPLIHFSEKTVSFLHALETPISCDIQNGLC